MKRVMMCLRVAGVLAFAAGCALGRRCACRRNDAESGDGSDGGGDDGRAFLMRPARRLQKRSRRRPWAGFGREYTRRTTTTWR